MFSSIVMDVAIGLMFVYIFLSVVCSMITEWLASWRKWRPKMLYQSIQDLIKDPSILDRFYKDPLFLGGDKKTGQPTEAYHPSYISSRSFALALVSSLKPAEAGKAAPAPPDLKDFKKLKSLVDDLPDGKLKQALLPLAAAAEDKAEVFFRNVEAWYDDAMDRVIGWYKRKSQLWIFILALAVSAGLNADSFTIAKSLYSDQGMRESVVAAALQAAPKDQQEKQAKDKILKKAEALNLPLGWDAKTLPSGKSPGECFLNWLIKILGLLFTAVAVSQGAPFWFDILNKFINLRGTGKKPPTAEEKQAAKP